MIHEFDDNDIRELWDMVRIGIVSSVDKEKMTARVKIEEMDIVTGDLKVVQNTPLITVVNSDNGFSWDYEAEYVQHDRGLGLGETYKQEYPDNIRTQKALECVCGVVRKQDIKIYPWLPYIGQWVLCIFKPGGEGDGFILGGI